MPSGLFKTVFLAFVIIALVLVSGGVFMAVRQGLKPPRPKLADNDKRIAVTLTSEPGAEATLVARQIWSADESIPAKPLREVRRIAVKDLPKRTRFQPDALAVRGERLFVYESNGGLLDRFRLPDLKYLGFSETLTGTASQSVWHFAVGPRDELLILGSAKSLLLDAEPAELVTDPGNSNWLGCIVDDSVFLLPARAARDASALLDRYDLRFRYLDSLGERGAVRSVYGSSISVSDMVALDGALYLFSFVEATAVRLDPRSGASERIPFPGDGMRLLERRKDAIIARGRAAPPADDPGDLEIVAKAAAAGGHIYLLTNILENGRKSGLPHTLVIAEVDGRCRPSRIWQVNLQAARRSVFLQIYIRDFAVSLEGDEPTFFLTIFRYFNGPGEREDGLEFHTLHVLRPAE